ncbi:MAG: hypothetical protein R3F34_17640 [Planctomycetota bacterium]
MRTERDRVGRASRVAALTLLLLAASCGEDRPDVPETAQDTTPGSIVRDDPRVASIPDDCRNTDPFTGDTADPVAILVRKLTTGDSEVWQRAAEELAAMGDEALPALERKLTDQLYDPAQIYALLNTISAIARIETPRATELLLLAFNHPQPEVRSQVLSALARREIPAEYFDLLAEAATHEIGNAALFAWSAAFRADESRAAALFLDQLEAAPQNGDPEFVGKMLAAVDDAPGLDRIAALHDRLPDRLQPYAEVALYADGRGEYADVLADRLAFGEPKVRSAVLVAAVANDAIGLVVEFDKRESNENLKLLALGELARHTTDAYAQGSIERLEAALDDESPDIRKVALDALIRIGHAGAIDRAISMLGGGRRDLETVLVPLHERMLVDPELTRRVYDRIREQIGDPELSDARRDVHLLQALALCPSEEAAKFVLDVGANAPPDARIEGIRAHRFLAIQASNTGTAGRAYVVRRLEDEHDPLRRIDLVTTIASSRDDLAREALIDLVGRDDLEPWERVYAAQLLARTGPTAVVAPVLKSVANRLEGAPRRAVECLLWYWY